MTEQYYVTDSTFPLGLELAPYSPPANPGDTYLPPCYELPVTTPAQDDEAGGSQRLRHPQSHFQDIVNYYDKYRNK